MSFYKQRPQAFKLSHAFYLSLLVTLWILSAIGAIEFLKSDFDFPPEIVIHIGIIVICWLFAKTALRPSTNRSLLWLLGFRSTRLVYYLMALAFAATLWAVDFWFQSEFLAIRLAENASRLKSLLQQEMAIVMVLSSALIAPIAEEVLFRGIILKALLTRLKPVWAILLSSLLFSLIHFSLSDAITLLLAGLIYAVLTLKSNSILPALVSHIANNTITLFYYKLV